jgi:hypothetical protein
MYPVPEMAVFVCRLYFPTFRAFVLIASFVYIYKTKERWQGFCCAFVRSRDILHKVLLFWKQDTDLITVEALLYFDKINTICHLLSLVTNKTETNATKQPIKIIPVTVIDLVYFWLPTRLF